MRDGLRAAFGVRVNNGMSMSMVGLSPVILRTPVESACWERPKDPVPLLGAEVF